MWEQVELGLGLILVCILAVVGFIGCCVYISLLAVIACLPIIIVVGGFVWGMMIIVGAFG